jgi:pimeloyl-ACP methyl ester carboxylesterase
MFMPFQILGVWLRAVLAFALIGGGVSLLTLWNDQRSAPAVRVEEREDRSPDEGESGMRVEYVTQPLGWNWAMAYLAGGTALLAAAGLGWSVPVLYRRRGDPVPPTPGGRTQRLRRPDGSELHVEVHGPEGAPALVLTHGWGLDAEEWRYARRELAGRFRLITWDLPGLGRSDRPADNDWSLDRMARDLDAVVGLAGGPVVLVGHSIGGMIMLSYCRLFPEALGGRVCGLVIAHSTYTNPVKTARHGGLLAALQKPVLEPLCHLMVWLSPVVWLSNLLDYLNGSAQRLTERASFSGGESRAQLDFLTRYLLQVSPAVVARGFLAMFRYDATEVLRAIPVPALVVAAGSDTLCLPEASRYMASTIPGGRLLTLGGARHAGLFERHGEFNAAVAEFASAHLERVVV